MATRFYLVPTTVPANLAPPAPNANWNSTAGYLTRWMRTSGQGGKGAGTETRTGAVTSGANQETLGIQFISPPLAAGQALGGTTVTITSRGRMLASDDGLNQRFRYVALVSRDGQTLRGSLLAYNTSASTTALTTTLAGQAHAGAVALSAVTTQAGDRLVVEIGYGMTTSGVTPQFDMVAGGSGTDHANVNGDTTGTVPWIEFSANLVFEQPAAQVEQRTSTEATGRKQPAVAARADQRTTTQASAGSAARVGATQVQQRTTTTAAGVHVGLRAGRADQRTTTQATSQRVVPSGAGRVDQRTTTAATSGRLAAGAGRVDQRPTTTAAGAKLAALAGRTDQRVSTLQAGRKTGTAPASAQARATTTATAGPGLRGGAASTAARPTTRATSGRLATRAARIDQRAVTAALAIPSRSATMVQRTSTSAAGLRLATRPGRVDQRTTTVAAGARSISRAARVDQRSSTAAAGLRLAARAARLDQRTSTQALAPPPLRAWPARVDQRTATSAAGGLPPAPPTTAIRLEGREPHCTGLGGREPAGVLGSWPSGGGRALAGRRGTLALSGSRPPDTLSGKEQGR